MFKNQNVSASQQYIPFSTYIPSIHMQLENGKEYKYILMLYVHVLFMVFIFNEYQTYE